MPDARTRHPVTTGVTIPAESPATTDAELIGLSLREPERFAALFDRHAAEIRRYALGRLGPDLADDITAETFLTAFRKRDRYDLDRDDARPWLYGIATRWISEHRRFEHRRYRHLARTPAPEPPEPFEEAAEARVSASRMLPVVAGVLASLPAADRDLLLLVAWTDLTYEDIARSLAIAPGTVASRLHRIRRKIRGRLGQQGPAGTYPEES
jgi:RNA polymerase sigma-70 factor (ECF subfamily)